MGRKEFLQRLLALIVAPFAAVKALDSLNEESKEVEETVTIDPLDLYDIEWEDCEVDGMQVIHQVDLNPPNVIWDISTNERKICADYAWEVSGSVVTRDLQGNVIDTSPVPTSGYHWYPEMGEVLSCLDSVGNYVDPSFCAGA